GLGWHHALAHAVENSHALSGLRAHFDLKIDALARDLGCALLDAFHEHCRVIGKDPPARPRVCVVGRRESPVFSDVRMLVEAFREAGLCAAYADPREFDETADGLTHEGQRVDLIYRDGIQELISPAAFDKTRKILDACRERKVCVVNPLAARRMSLKSLMALMSDNATNGVFTEEERRHIARFLPWTRLVRAATTTYDNRSVRLDRFIIENRLNLIMKPVYGYGGRDVFIGRDADPETWRAVLSHACQGVADYLVQEYVEPGVEQLPQIDPHGRIVFHPLAANLGLWVFNQRFAGAYVRTSESSVVNVHRGGAIIPVAYLT
ncbi:MAG TPA: hypothetical protein VGV59_18420, partial [Pyrinomonadaceae bacterium]|nr:hypothetical protein [Pyrinomonadaceae bacterium]